MRAVGTVLDQRVVDGDEFTCVVKTDGSVRCWGMNGDGQLGVGEVTHTSPELTYAHTAKSLSGATGLSSRGVHNCAIRGSGFLTCWGGNSSGQLGRLSLLNALMPLQVPACGDGLCQYDERSSASCDADCTPNSNDGICDPFLNCELNELGYCDEDCPKVYEDGEDGTTEGWYLADSTPAGATIENVVDAEHGSKVIKTTMTGTLNSFALKKPDGTTFNDYKRTTIRWSAKCTGNYCIVVPMKTSLGWRSIGFYAQDNDPTDGAKNYLYAIGSAAGNGTWQTFTFDLTEYLQAAVPEAEIIRVHYFVVRGSCSFDDLSLR